MNDTDGRTALAERAEVSATQAGKEAGKDAAAPQAGTAREAVEKPETTGEIVIEEINIDGMCGVY